MYGTNSKRGETLMKSTYFEEGDVLRVRISEQPVARKVAQDDNVHIAYGADGSVVEVVLLNAMVQGWVPLCVKLPLPRPVSRLRDALVRLLSLAKTR
jgi:hypothetical protein